MPDGRAAVVLAQLGGPETLDEVRPFLYNFFVDLIPDNIPVPPVLIKPTAWLISTVRAPYSRKLYASIGGGSPLRDQSEAQSRALAAELERRGSPLPVHLAMRNWRPFSDEALEAMRTERVERIVFVPLYPQYSFSTTRSSLNELRRVMKLMRYEPELLVVDQYCDDPDFLVAVADLTRTRLAEFASPRADIHLIFSAHGLPMRYIERGDPYFEQVNRSVAGVAALLGHPGPVHTSFQSRLGPEKWLEPATEELIARLGSEGARAVCVVPIAFVSEHVETLNEIDIQYAQVAREHGIDEFKRVPTVQTHPSFIACLANAVERSLHPVGAPT